MAKMHYHKLSLIICDYEKLILCDYEKLIQICYNYNQFKINDVT